MLQDNNPEIKKILKQLKQTELAYQMATEMSQFKAGFLARIAHELRSPLNSLIGLHQLILSDLCDNPEEEREFITQAHASALKLMKLIDEIVAVSRSEHGTNLLEIQPVHLTGLLQEVYKLTYLQAANHSLNLQISPLDPEIYVLADPRRLRQVLVNLISSTLDAMQEGTIQVSVYSSVTDRLVYIWIDGDFLPNTWSEPLNLLQSNQHKINLEQPTLSPGLNLYINQTLMELMQGRLQLVEAPQTAASEQASANIYRLQCSIPLVIPENVGLEQA